MSYSDYILKHYYKYPLMRTQDFVKLIYQSEYGAHFGMSYDVAYLYLVSECKKLTPSNQQLVTPISPDLLRIDLNAFLYQNLDLTILANMFSKSGLQPQNNDALVAKLEEFANLCVEKKVNLQPYAVKNAVRKYAANPVPVSHSACYRKNYAPAYRVVRKQLWNMYDCIVQVEESTSNGAVIFCIDGGSGSGKSFYGALLKDYFGDRCSLFSTDDFFLPEKRKTPQRMAEIGGNIDYEALEELIKEIRKGELIVYKKFNCHTQTYKRVREMPKQINIIEGVYSAHPNLIKHYDMVVLFTIDKKTQQLRILKRNGQEVLDRYNNEWLPLEEKYLQNLDTSSKMTFTYDFDCLNQD